MQIYIFIFVIVMFIIFSIIFLNGKGASLIAGYNLMDKKKRSKYDEKKLCKFMGKMTLTYAFSFLLILIGNITNMFLFALIGIVLFFIFVIFTIITISKKEKFYKVKK